ncbi:MAG: PIG-L family deacetylase [Cytophagales bacterium]|nr:PIG-L family deacetylase [Cytophagales bacterium]
MAGLRPRRQQTTAGAGPPRFSLLTSHFYTVMFRRFVLPGCLVAGLSFSGFTQPTPDRVLTQSGPQFGARDLPQDRGAAGVWQKLLKLQTTGSVLHTTAHPDDEHADLLTYLGRGTGARTALLSLNRGEGGANVLGPELFDALGLLRTEEMLLAGTYYGLDDLYFTDVADYGYSKRVAEAYDKWDAQHVLGEMVRVIRLNRPVVVISRFHGSARDGHGNHQAAGELTQKAFGLAGDPSAFPEQITREGLRPWQPRKLYRGGIRTGETHHYVLESGAYCPWLGSSYKNFSLLGYSFHRSQFSGVRREVSGTAVQRYERLRPAAGDTAETDPFAGLDTSVGGVFALTGETPPKAAARLVRQIEASIGQAVVAFAWHRPEATVPALAAALEKTRQAVTLLDGQPEARFLLLVKERQLMEVIHAALGILLRATAAPVQGSATPSFFAPPPALPAAVPGQPFAVETTFLNPGGVPVTLQRLEVNPGSGGRVEPAGPGTQPLKPNQPLESRFTVTLPAAATYPGPYFYRTSPGASRYQIREPAYRHLPYGPAALGVTATYLVAGQRITVQQPVLTRAASLPYGYDEHTLRVLHPVAVSLSPAAGIIPLAGKPADIPVQVQLVHYAEGNATGTLRLSLPPGWRATPAEIPFAFSHAGEKRSFPVRVTPVLSGPGPHVLKAVAILNGREYDAGYQLIAHRDQDRHYVSGPAEMRIAGVDVRVAPGLKVVGYVMGAGDDIPAALTQLGVAVHLLTPADLANADLDGFGAILVGSRAYAVRPDLVTYNRRLLDYAARGGHLVVLYQTPEFVPAGQAPFPAALPPEAEEVSEEDAPVQLLSADHRLLNVPNKITPADFDGWIEQRGSKFFSQWDAAYLPLLASQDQGQEPQRGGWLTAPTGKGHYTYFAYALHRQLPYGVPGAYRLLANLVSYGK